MNSVTNQSLSLSTVKHNYDKMVKEKNPNLVISKETIRKLMNGPMGLSYKKCAFKDVAYSSERNTKLREFFCTIVMGFLNLGIHLVWMDECSTNETSLRKYAWSKRGETNSVINSSRQTSVSTIAAMDQEGLLLIKSFKHTIAGADIVEFLKELKDSLEDVFKHNDGRRG